MKIEIKGAAGKRSRTSVLLLIILFVSLKAPAQHYFASVSVNEQKISIDSAFDQIEVKGNVRIVLSDELIVKGDTKNIGHVKAFVKNGKLIVNASRNYDLKELTIYLPVLHVKTLVVNGDSEVYFEGSKQPEGLEIIIKSDALVSVNYLGKFKIVSGQSFEPSGSR